MTTATTQAPAGAHAATPETSAPPVTLDTLTTPGAYVCHWSGHLLRVPTRGLGGDGRLRLNIIGSAPLTLTKISDDPDVPLGVARGLAARRGLRIGF